MAFPLADTQKVQLTVVFRDAVGTEVTAGVPTWNSSNDGVIHLDNINPPDPTGRNVEAIGQAPGSATVTATLGAAVASFDFEVTPGDAVSGTITAGTPEPK